MSKEYIIKYKNNNIAVVYAYCVNGTIENPLAPKCMPRIDFYYAPLLVFDAMDNIDLISEMDRQLPQPKQNTKILIISVVNNKPTWLIPYLIDYYKDKCSILILYDFESHSAGIVYSHDNTFKSFSYRCHLESKYSTVIENGTIYCNTKIYKNIPSIDEIERCIEKEYELIPELEIKEEHHKLYRQIINNLVRKR